MRRRPETKSFMSSCEVNKAGGLSAIGYGATRGKPFARARPNDVISEPYSKPGAPPESKAGRPKASTFYARKRPWLLRPSLSSGTWAAWAVWDSSTELTWLGHDSSRVKPLSARQRGLRPKGRLFKGLREMRGRRLAMYRRGAQIGCKTTEMGPVPRPWRWSSCATCPSSSSYWR